MIRRRDQIAGYVLLTVAALVALLPIRPTPKHGA
jgi:hypothetical protein